MVSRKAARTLTSRTDSPGLGRSITALINPGARRFDQHIGDVVDVLKGLKEELETADRQIDTDDAKEFAKWFDGVAEAEVEDLHQTLKVSSVFLRLADDTAGVVDRVKNLFKKAPVQKGDGESGASYDMPESEMDDFVEGKRDWSDPSAKVEKESRENKEFFEDAKNVQQLLEKVREKPSRKMVRMIIKDLDELIERGTAIMGKGRKSDKVPQAEDFVGVEKPVEKPGSSGKPDLGFNVQHYTDMLIEAMGDEKATLKVLKEFFKVMEPHLASRSNRVKLSPSSDT